jgi:phage virion morphogenesis protein
VSEVAGVSISTITDDTVSAELSKLARRITDIDPVLEDMAESNVTETKMRFERAEGPDGAKWKGLAAATLARPGRVRDGGTARVLQDNRHLFDSVHPQVLSGVGFEVGVSMVYGRIHQLGGQAGRNHAVKIEARPYLGISEAGRKELLAIMQDHLKG